MCYAVKFVFLTLFGDLTTACVLLQRLLLETLKTYNSNNPNEAVQIRVDLFLSIELVLFWLPKFLLEFRQLQNTFERNSFQGRKWKKKTTTLIRKVYIANYNGRWY